jgi:hypothetical protein
MFERDERKVAPANIERDEVSWHLPDVASDPPPEPTIRRPPMVILSTSGQVNPERARNAAFD